MHRIPDYFAGVLGAVFFRVASGTGAGAVCPFTEVVCPFAEVVCPFTVVGVPFSSATASCPRWEKAPFIVARCPLPRPITGAKVL
ncbi:hypothetical protein DFH08DRAFT_882022 [Mycena albidolilacea]|uniref:Secreted protein n=1 Tax=Mycena albidolilacea TaxID=1033008 RepID=A0AAD7EJB8_9AGAR|nr:hypothetical protein DFH08DRAFT_882022 [Mycena albidolilacea]